MKLFTVSEVARKLKVTKSYVYDLIGMGLLKAIRLSERRTRISEESIFIALEQLSKRAKASYNKVVQPPLRGRKPNGTI